MISIKRFVKSLVRFSPVIALAVAVGLVSTCRGQHGGQTTLPDAPMPPVPAKAEQVVEVQAKDSDAARTSQAVAAVPTRAYYRTAGLPSAPAPAAPMPNDAAISRLGASPGSSGDETVANAKTAETVASAKTADVMAEPTKTKTPDEVTTPAKIVNAVKNAIATKAATPPITVVTPTLAAPAKKATTPAKTSTPAKTVVVVTKKTSTAEKAMPATTVNSISRLGASPGSWNDETVASAKTADIVVSPTPAAPAEKPKVAETPKPVAAEMPTLAVVAEPAKIAMRAQDPAPAEMAMPDTAYPPMASTPYPAGAYSPAEMLRFRCGVECNGCPLDRRLSWLRSQPIPWEVFAQGEYVGPPRLAHIREYRLRVDDTVEFVYILSGKVSGRPYRLNVRDRLQIESATVPELINRDILIQPDGTITLPGLGQVPAAGTSIEELRGEVESRYQKIVREPSITITPLELGSDLEQLRAAVDARFGSGGQRARVRVTPEGTVQLPVIGSVPVQGLTLPEAEREVEQRYGQLYSGLDITPILLDRAPRYVYVVGEVRAPGRYTLEGPTTAVQAIALAGSWNVGAHLKHVVIFRRDDNWRLVATKLDLYNALQGHAPCPADEIWLRDSDIVIVPKSPILVADDMIELLFTRGLYGIMPTNTSINFAKLSTL